MAEKVSRWRQVLGRRLAPATPAGEVHHLHAAPTEVPVIPHDVTHGGVTYHIQGSLVPVLQVELGGIGIYFEHHVLLWKDPAVAIDVKREVHRTFAREVSGQAVFMAQAKGPGRIGLSRSGAGSTFAIHLEPGHAIDVREHQFLAATETVDVSFQQVKGAASILHGGVGFLIDEFVCNTDDGIVWLHGHGDIFELDLDEGEQIDVEPAGWIYKDSTVTLESRHERYSLGVLEQNVNVYLNRFTGPGRLGIQSM